MSQIGEQAVGNIDGGGGQSTQRVTERDTRCRPLQARDQRLPFRLLTLRPALQGGCRITRTAREVDRVTGTRAVAPQGLAGWQVPEAGHGQRQHRTARGVAAGQRHVVVCRQRHPAVAEAIEPAAIRQRRQAQREQRGHRLGAHGGEVAEVHRQRLPGDVGRIAVGVEVPAFDQRVATGDDLVPGRRRPQRRVIADAKVQARATGVAETAAQVGDEVEFGHGDAMSACRVRRGIRPRVRGRRAGRARR